MTLSWCVNLLNHKMFGNPKSRRSADLLALSFANFAEKGQIIENLEVKF